MTCSAKVTCSRSLTTATTSTSSPCTGKTSGDPDTKARVPEQFSHNLTLNYSVAKGRYNFSLECRNLTDEKLYDNYSLQKAGRAFYGKVRVYFGK